MVHDLLLMDTVRSSELSQRMAAGPPTSLDWDAQALVGPLDEAAVLLERPMPDVATGVRRLAEDLRASAVDLKERTHAVETGGPEINEGLAALEQVREQFTFIETRGGSDKADGILSRRDLVWASQSSDDDTAKAAAWLLEHDQFFDKVETAKHNDDYLDRVHEGVFHFDRDDRDSRLSLDDIDAFVDKTTAWSRLIPHIPVVDVVAGGPADGFVSRSDFEAFLNDYHLAPEVSSAVEKVLEDRAYHTRSSSISMGTMLDALSFVPVVGDIVDGARAIYYALYGDYATASLFALGLVPLPGLSSSGVRGAIKVVDAVVQTARTSGAKAATREAAQRAMKGTAANYAAYESATRASAAIAGDVELDDSIEYVLDDVLGDRLEASLGEELDPRLREVLTDHLESSLHDRLDPDTAQWLSDANVMIARRIAEHQAHELTFRRLLRRAS